MKTKISVLSALLAGSILAVPVQAQQGPPAAPEEIGATILSVAAFMAESCPGVKLHEDVVTKRLEQLGVAQLDYINTPRLAEMLKFNLTALQAYPAEKVCGLMFTGYGPNGTALPGMVTRQ